MYCLFGGIGRRDRLKICSFIKDAGSIPAISTLIMFFSEYYYLYLIISFFLIIVSLFIFLTKNAVHSVLYLILAFFSSSILLFILDIEFLGIIFIIIYVGAIAILFLFIVMMLNNKTLSFDPKNYFIVFFLLISIFLIQSYSTLFEAFKEFNNKSIYLQFSSFSTDNLTNLNLLGQILFNYYNSCFLLAGLVLLVAMIGAIVLSLNFEVNSKTQLLYRQLSRSESYFYFF